MKKLMTALSAAALAMGAFATDYHNESFEDGTLMAGWSSTGESAIVDGAGGNAAASRPTYWVDQGQAKSYSIKTAFSAPAWCNVVAGGTTTATDMGTVYYDSYVKFTACDEDVTLPTDANAKIAVWIKEMTDSAGAVTGTNLFVTAGTVGGSAQNYDCGSIADYGIAEWSRLTIKSIKDATDKYNIPAFVVFVNAKAAKCNASKGFTVANLSTQGKVWNNSNALFPSIMGSGYNTISQVGYAGQGGVDDISFITTEPSDTTQGEPEEFAKDIDQFIISWTASDVKSVTTPEGCTLIDGKIYAPITLKTVSVGVDYADGKMAGEWTASEGNSVSGNTFTLAAAGTGTIVAQNVAATVNGKNYASVSAAVEDFNNLGTGTHTFKLMNNYTGDALVFANEACDMMILDLAGQTVTGAISFDGGKLLITNSTETVGSVTGKIDNSVNAASLTIVGGKFDYAANTNTTGACSIEATYPAGYTLAKNDETPAYWVLKHVGQGTEADPYLIFTVADLKAVKKGADSDGVYYRLESDIALTDDWEGIGAFDAKDNLGTAATYIAGAFQGNFDGNGKTISGLKLKRGDYVGFFGSTYGATIKNLKISLGNETGFGESSTSTDTATNYGGGAFVGVSVNTTIENCQTLKTTDYTTFKGTKAIGGIVGYAAKGTVVKGCVNNLNLETSNEKCGGIMAIAQNTGNWAFADVVIDGCTNNGNVYCSTTGKVFLGGLCSYSDIVLNFKGANVVAGTLTQAGSTVVSSVAAPNGGSFVLDSSATFTVPAAYPSTSRAGKAVDGLFFATVDGDVATLVKNSAAVAGANLKVMASGATVTLATVGDSITLDTSLGTTVTVNTSAENAYVAQSGNVYTVTAKTTPAITVTIDPAIVEYTAGLTFPTPVVTGASDYTTSWNPNTITEPAAGETNTYTVTVSVAATETTLATSAEAKWQVYKKAAGPTIPEGQGSIDVDAKGNVNVTPAEGTTEIELSGVSADATVTIPTSVEKIKGVEAEKVQITYTATDAGSTTYNITGAFIKTGDAAEGVTYDLDPSGSVDVDGVTVPVTPTIEAAESTEGTIADGAVATKAIPGLTYELMRMENVGDEPASIGDGIKKTAISGTVSLKDNSASKPTDKAFYVIKVSK